MKWHMVYGHCCLDLALLLCFSASQGIVTENKFELKFSWNNLLFDWPNLILEESAVSTRHYIPDNNIPFGLAVWYNKIFVTVPRDMEGVLSTLNFFEIKYSELSPKLKPYPSWGANILPLDVLQEKAPNYSSFKLKDASSLVSVMRIHVDACDRLWALDTGMLDIPGNKRQLAPSAIVIFDLRTDALVRRFIIPTEQAIEPNGLANIIVEAEPWKCNDAYAYLSNYITSSLIVYSYRENNSYRVNQNYFHMDPLESNFNVSGFKFQWDTGLVGMALGPTKPDWLSADGCSPITPP